MEVIEVVVPKVPKTTVDILFIVDNTKTMRPIWKNITTRLNDSGGKFFLDYLNELDWKIAFLSSAPSPQSEFSFMSLEHNDVILTNKKFISKGNDDVEKIFLDTLTYTDTCVFPPFCGHRVERPLRVLHDFFDGGNSGGFLREQADLEVIIITDTKENKYKLGSNKIAIIPDNVLNKFNTMKEAKQNFDEKKLTVHAATVLNHDCKDIMESGIFRDADFAPSIVSLVTKTNGLSISVCSSNYNSIARAIKSRKVGTHLVSSASNANR